MPRVVHIVVGTVMKLPRWQCFSQTGFADLRRGEHLNAGVERVVHRFDAKVLLHLACEAARFLVPNRWSNQFEVTESEICQGMVRQPHPGLGDPGLLERTTGELGDVACVLSRTAKTGVIMSSPGARNEY